MAISLRPSTQGTLVLPCDGPLARRLVSRARTAAVWRITLLFDRNVEGRGRAGLRFRAGALVTQWPSLVLQLLN